MLEARRVSMQTVTTIAAVREQVARWRAAGERVVFVPTMGNLHAGHVSLIEAARKHGKRFVASIFVNPMQFGPNEDFAHYPRTPTQDAGMLEAAGCARPAEEFTALLRILDTELRLITPTADISELSAPGPDPAEDGRPGSQPARYYQLTHDYLVPALREWLTRQQRETRGGRAELCLDERAAEKKKLRGEFTSAEWGNQIRSYVLHPYQMVKDHRTKYETADTRAVLDGDLDPFVEAYLKLLKSGGKLTPDAVED